MIVEVKERLQSELNRAVQNLPLDVAQQLVSGSARVRTNPSPAGDPQGRVRRLRQLDAGLAALHPESLAPDRVGYGSSVVLEDLGTRRRVSYMLVTADVIDLEEDQVTLASPIGAALLGRKKGERIEVALPQGRKRFRIVELTTLPQMLGLES